MDFGETSDVDSVVIVPDKRSGFGITSISLEFNATNEWSSPAATESVTFSDVHGVGISEFTQTRSYRFCRLVLTSTLGYCELANIFIGKKQALNRGISFGWSYKDEDRSIKRFNRYGQQFTDVINRAKIINAQLSLLDKEQIDEFFDVYDRCGESKPFFIKIGCDTMINDYRRFSGMVYFQDVPTITNGSFGRYSLSMSLREAT
jgi:hypothetical protein